jgi:hypothetical protein
MSSPIGSLLKGTNTVGTGASDSTSPLSVRILSSEIEIRNLRGAVRDLNPGHDPFDRPEFFLASLSNQWKPRVAVVYDDSHIAGIIYWKERVIAGVPLGIYYGDGTIGGMLVAPLSHEEEIFRAGIQYLSSRPSVRGIRLRISPGSAQSQVIRTHHTFSNAEVHISRIRNHARLPLAGSYPAFLAGLGPTLRRNFRYYRRRFEAAGHQFRASMTTDQMHHAAWDLREKCSISGSSDALKRLLNMVSASDHPMALGLLDKSGKWLAVAGGVFRHDGAMMFFQLNNDLEFEKDSLSLVLRAYLIEALIERGARELLFWAGVGGPLRSYVSFLPVIEVQIDRPSIGWRLTRRLIRRISPYFSDRYAADLKAIAPVETTKASAASDQDWL